MADAEKSLEELCVERGMRMTDQRRVIDYLLSPIAKIGSEAMRER